MKVLFLILLSLTFDDISEEKDAENDSSVEISDISTSSLDNKFNVKDNAPKMLDNKLQSNFIRMLYICPDRILLVLKYLCCQKDKILL